MKLDATLASRFAGIALGHHGAAAGLRVKARDEFRVASEKAPVDPAVPEVRAAAVGHPVPKSAAAF